MDSFVSANNISFVRLNKAYQDGSKFSGWVSTTPSGSIVSVACRNHYNTPQPVPVSMAYNMPQPTWTISYNTWDEGYHNINGTYANTIPANTVVQVRDNNDFYKVQFDKENRGHLYRFLGLNGGYWNSDLASYHLADGTVSNRATVFDNDAYTFDRLTGLGFRNVRTGSASLTAGIANAEGYTYNGFTNWHLPFKEQVDSIVDIRFFQAFYANESPVFRMEFMCKTVTPRSNNPTTHGWMRNADGDYDNNRTYTTPDPSFIVRDARGQF
jgi:hypothetical protein